ncbi:MAG: phage late control D family protein [Methylocystis sp.]|uniref:phage late control D family protein n=1 Tax=Methylocystis sp. TaxID=1911079 RepID=UPI003DA3B176
MTAPIRDLYASTVPTIEVGGERVFSVLRDVLDLRVSIPATGSRRLRLRLSAAPTGARADETALLYLDGRLFDFGKDVAVLMGPADRQEKVFEGKISRIDAILVQGRPAEVEIHAEDRLIDLAMTRRTRTYEKATAGDLVRQVAAAHGLSADVAVDGPQQALVQQWNESDLGFLTTQLAALGADLWFAAGQLHACDRYERRANALTLHAGAELLSLGFSADLAAQRSSVVMGGYDMNARESVAETSAAPDVASLTRSGRSGLDLLSAAFGARDTARRLAAVTASDEARALAKAAHRARTRRFVKVEALATILPEIVCGARLTFEGAGEMFGGGGYVVTDAAHSFDRASGATTFFCAERATVNGGS